MKQYPKINVKLIFCPYPLPASEQATEEHKRKIEQNFLDECVRLPYTKYCAAGYCKLFGVTTIYRWLQDNGHLQIDEDARLYMEAKARERCHGRLSQEILDNHAERNAMRQIIALLEKGEGDDAWAQDYQEMAILATFTRWQGEGLTPEQIQPKQ